MQKNQSKGHNYRIARFVAITSTPKNQHFPKLLGKCASKITNSFRQTTGSWYGGRKKGINETTSLEFREAAWEKVLLVESGRIFSIGSVLLNYVSNHKKGDAVLTLSTFY